MTKFWVGLIVGVILVPVIVSLYLSFGFAPAAATAPPMPFERLIAGTALRNRIRREAPHRDVSAFTTAQLLDGADVYKKNCAECHGNLGQPAPVIAGAMFPRAPQLMTAEGSVSDDPAGVTYWKVENGIRLSAMPGFKMALAEDQKWDVAALLARSDKLPPEVQDALKSTSEASAAVSPASQPTPSKKR